MILYSDEWADPDSKIDDEFLTEITYDAKEGMSDPQYTHILESVVTCGIEAKQQGKPQYLIITIKP